MPKIPMRATQSPVSRQVGAGPSLDNAGARQVAQATQNLGQTLSNVGDMAFKFQKMEDRRVASERALEDIDKAERFRKEDLEIKGPDGHEQRFNNFLQKEIKEKSAKELDSGLTGGYRSSFYQDQVAQSFQRMSLGSFRDEFEGIDANKTLFYSKSSSDIEKEQYENPNLEAGIEKMTAVLKNAEADSSEGALFKESYEKIKKEGPNGLSVSHLNSLLRKKKISDGLNKLANNDYIKENLTPKQMNSFLRLFKSAQEQQNEVSVSEARSMYNDLKTAYLNRETVTNADVNAFKAKVAALPDKGGAKLFKKQAGEFLNDVRVAGDFLRSLPSMKNSDIPIAMANMSEEIKSKKSGFSKFGRAHDEAVKAQVATQVKKELVQRQTNAHGYVYKNNGDLQEMADRAEQSGNPADFQAFLAKSIEYQKNMDNGSSRFVRVTFPQEAENIAHTLNQTTNPSIAVQQINAIQQKYGKYSKALIADIAKIEGNAQAMDYILPMYLDSDASKLALIENIQQERDNKSISSRVSDVSKTYVKKEAAKLFSKFGDGLLAGSNDSQRRAVLNSFINHVHLDAYKNIKVDSSKREAEAEVERAYKRIIKANFDVVSSGKSNAIIPKSAQIDTEKIESFLDNYSSSKALLSLSPIGPRDDVGLIKSLGKDAYNEAVGEQLEDNHKWVTNDDQTGLKLMFNVPGIQMTPITTIVKDDNGKPIYDPVIDSRGQQVVGSNGKPLMRPRTKPIEFSFEEIESDLYKMEFPSEPMGAEKRLGGFN